MLAELRRRRPLPLLSYAGELERRAGHQEPLQPGHRQQHAAGGDLRIVEQVGDRVYRRCRNAGGRQPLQPVRVRMAPQGRLQLPLQCRHVLVARRIAAETAVGRQVVAPDHRAQGGEQAIVAGRDDDLLVGRGVGFERGDRRVAGAQRRRHGAGDLIAGDRVLQNRDGGVEHAQVQHGAAP